MCQEVIARLQASPGFVVSPPTMLPTLQDVDNLDDLKMVLDDADPVLPMNANIKAAASGLMRSVFPSYNEHLD